MSKNEGKKPKQGTSQSEKVSGGGKETPLKETVKSQTSSEKEDKAIASSEQDKAAACGINPIF